MKKLILVSTLLFSFSLASAGTIEIDATAVKSKKTKLTKAEKAVKTDMARIMNQVSQTANAQYKELGFYPETIDDLGLSEKLMKRLDQYSYDYFGNDSDFLIEIQSGDLLVMRALADEIVVTN